MEEIKNCWEYMGCFRKPGDNQVSESGKCPVPMEKKFDGVNRGKNAGRFCWAVPKASDQDKTQEEHAVRFFSCCMKCPFYREVERQEGRYFILSESQLNKTFF